jgi:2-octaprenyl-6-methoxyphenol hydroxylase
MHNKLDIIVIGGGLVGFALARAVSVLGYKVTLVEAREVQSPKITELDNRSIALSYPTISALKSLGVWESLSNHAQEIKKIHVSDKGRYGQSTIDGENEHLPFLGAVIEMPYLHNALIDSIKNENVEIISPAKVEAINESDSGYELQIKQDDNLQTFNAKLIIACDGANSQIREKLELPTFKKEYNQIAMVCNIQLKRGHEGIAYERFYQDGVTAMLPLTQNRCGCIWTMRPEQAEDFKQLSSAEVLKKIQNQFGYRLGRFENIGKTGWFPLSLIRAERLYKDNVLLFGNAAHFLHPVSAQGFNLSVRDIACLCDLLSEHGLNQDNKVLLQQYEVKRLSDQTRTANITNGLIDIFGEQSLKYRIGRGLGLHIFERTLFGKKIMNKIMMGRDGKLSRLHLNKVES